MDLQERFGRPLRLGILGGGPDSWIGRMHRGAAQFDGCWQVVAGVFSSDPQRSREAGPRLGVDAGRSYGTAQHMLAAEATRDDGIEAVAIMTPNDTHHPLAAAALDAGLDVMCDKPVAATLAQARDLAARVARSGRLLAIAHAYSAYPMVRLARQLVRDGVLGAVRLVQVEYIQSGMALRLEDAPANNRLRWLLDPARSGQALVMSAIGCHAQHLACFVAGQRIARVAAQAGALMPGRQLIDHVSALLEFEAGASGTFTATQAAAGAENDISLRVCGDKGLIEWQHRSAGYLRVALQGEPARTYGRGDAFLAAEITAAGRTPRGHPEGLREAFANLYAELARERMALALGAPVPAAPYPRIVDGVHTMAFIEACLRSSAQRTWAEVDLAP